MKRKLIQKLKNKNSIIGIVGLGYVGIPLVISFVSKGYKVIGFEINTNKIKDFNNGKSNIHHIPSSKIENVIKNGSYATNNFSKINEVDAIILCVPTPLKSNRLPDLKFINNALNLTIPYIKKGQVISLESTTYPGTTEEKILPRIMRRNFKIGKDFFLVYSPEREDPGNKKFSTQTIPKIVGGITKECLSVGKELYNGIISQIVPVSSTRTAEMTKLLENIHRAVNIGLVNEMKIISDKMNVNIHEVIAAASTKPFGFTPYYPGPGLGGHCIPIDPFYLTWKAKQVGVETKFIELSGKINRKMPNWVLKKIIYGIKFVKKIPSSASVLILGVAYKKDIDDVRESPAIVIIEKLIKLGVKVKYSDKFVDQITINTKRKSTLKSIKINQNNIKKFDVVVLVTDHSYFNYNLIRKYSKIIVDTRGIYRADEKIITA